MPVAVPALTLFAYVIGALVLGSPATVTVEVHVSCGAPVYVAFEHDTVVNEAAGVMVIAAVAFAAV